ncbi:MAG: sigma-54-dependent Fis family transcriptional regulator [Halobacteriovoraceae bacterium]|nr:sigma-54-dependent Fis family transcriptional regulator [Halobacteriovoraceae bacterium]
MLASFSEFKFYQSFRVPVEKADNLRFLVEKEDELGKNVYIDDANLVDVSVSGLGFATKERISVGTTLSISLQFKKHHLDLDGKVVRAFSQSVDDDEIIYGIELGEEKGIHKFLENYILSFSSERLKECLIDSALKERYTKASDGFEMFSLLLSLFKDITHFGDREGFIDNMLEEVVRVMNAQRSTIFLINPDTNELEAVSALGVKKDSLKFDYRVGIAGCVFTTGVALNIDTVNDQTRFNEDFDKIFNFETKSIICHPLHNREDKIIGVIEVINRRNQDRFTVDDEKTMKVLALVFSSVFHNYNPLSEVSQIRRFSQPFDREYALIGKTPHVASLRNTIIKTKDIDCPALISGEKGTGKGLFSKILHFEGQRGLKTFEVIDCGEKDYALLEKQLWGPDESDCLLAKCQGGSLFLRDIDRLPLDYQKKLFEVLDRRGLKGGNITFDVRIIASTIQDLGQKVDDGEFDRNLFNYISKAFIYMEPLRRRPDDVEFLVDYFLKVECKRQGLLLKNFSPKASERMKAYDWPGNVKELKRCVERAVLYNPKAHVITDVEFSNSASPLMDVSAKQRMFGDLPHVSNFKVALKDRISIIEREMILAEIKRNNGNKSKAAKEMGISREALRKKLLMSQELIQVLEGEGQKKKAA